MYIGTQKVFKILTNGNTADLYGEINEKKKENEKKNEFENENENENNGKKVILNSDNVSKINYSLNENLGDVYYDYVRPRYVDFSDLQTLGITVYIHV
jgi:hypothetical protein